MRPKLKSDAFFIPSEEGVFFASSQGSFTLKGNSLYQWVERLSPHFDGRRTLEEITGGLDSDKATVVSKLVGVLLEKGYLKDLSEDLPHSLDPAEEDAYAPQISFIEYYEDSAARRFELFRESRVLLVGSGMILNALVQACLHSGIRRIGVAITGECETDRDRMFDCLEVSKEADPWQKLELKEAADWFDDETEVENFVEPFDAVIHVSDSPMLSRAGRLDRACLARGKVSIQTAVVGDTAWIGPLVPSGEAGGMRWEAAWHRLCANRSSSKGTVRGYEPEDYTQRPVSEFLAAPTAGIVANRLCFEIFKHITGAGPVEVAGRVIEVDLETLQSRHRHFLPHPRYALTPSPRRVTKESFLEGLTSADNRKLDEEAFSKAATALFDEELGVFGVLDEHDFRQIPLNVSRVTISNPTLVESVDQPVAIGLGDDVGTARRHATRRACEVYAASAVDPTRTFGLGNEHNSDVFPEPILNIEPPDAPRTWVWGYDLVSRHACAVPVEAAFPATQGIVTSEQSVPGLGSGFSWDEAVGRALVSHCALIVAEQAVDAAREVTFSQVDLEAVDLDEDGIRFKRMLSLMGADVAVYEVTGELGVQAFAFCSANETITYGCHPDVTATLRDGLQRVVQYHQSLSSGQPEYAPPRVPPLPYSRRSEDITTPRSAGSLDWQGVRHRLTGALAKSGYRVVAVPLDHDPAIIAALPAIFNVLVARG